MNIPPTSRRRRFLSFRSLRGLSAAMAGLLLGVGCASTTTPSGDVFSGSGQIESSMLAAGDVVQVTFPSADLDQSQKIRLDGKISMPIVGEVMAAGKTPKALQDELTAKYEEHLQDPKVIVSVKTAAAAVYVNGEVREPGKVLLERPMSVHEVIMESGGFSPIANPKKVIVTRQEDGKLHRHLLNMKPGSEDGTFLVKPYDTITVSQSWF